VDRIATRVALLISLAPIIVVAQATKTRKSIPTIAKAATTGVVLVVMGNDEPIATGTGFVAEQWFQTDEPESNWMNWKAAVATNYHVIAHGKLGAVKFSDGTLSPIDGILAADKVRDLAIVRIHTRPKGVRVLPLANSDRVEVGEDVVAIGNPLGLELSVSNGIVSGIRSDEKLGGKFLQITAPISHGSSGGPLFNMAGEVIGVTSLFIEGGENLNFAIPSNDVERLLGKEVSHFKGKDIIFSGIISAKLQPLPNEPLPDEQAKREKHNEESETSTESEYRWPEPVGLWSLARKFYDDDDGAGIFSPEEFGTAPDGSKVPLGRMSNADFVCISRETRSDEFFTFQARGYDREYAEATKAALKGGEDFEKQIKIKKVIQGNAPYLHFITFDLNGSRSLDRFLLDGGRILKKDIYSKGVKVDTFEYHWNGTSWFFHDLQFVPALFGLPRNPDMPTDIPKAHYLSLQLFKKDLLMEVLRYVESDVDGHVVASGYCEKRKEALFIF
jgi:hypothetical protein